PAVVRVVLARIKRLFDPAIAGHSARSGSEPDLWANRMDRERAFMQERFEDAEIRVAQFCPLDALLGVREQRLKGFHENEPDMHAGGVLLLSGRFALHCNGLLATPILVSIYYNSYKRH